MMYGCVCPTGNTVLPIIYLISKIVNDLLLAPKAALIYDPDNKNTALDVLIAHPSFAKKSKTNLLLHQHQFFFKADSENLQHSQIRYCCLLSATFIFSNNRCRKTIAVAQSRLNNTSDKRKKRATHPHKNSKKFSRKLQSSFELRKQSKRLWKI